MDEQVLSIAMVYGPRVLVAIILLAAGYFAGQWAGRAAARGLGRNELEPPVLRLIENAVRVAVFALFAIMALQNIGVELLPLIAGLGVAGAAIALAMQGVLGNVAAGLTIIFSKPFRVGDYISIVGVVGEVLDIRLSSTTLGHADLSRVVIPNRKIVGEILHNYGRIRQLALEVNVPYEADVDDALDTARAVLRANRRVLADPAPGVSIARLTDTGVTLGITPWVAVTDYGAAGAELNQAILAAFRNRKILRTSAAYLAAA